MRGGGVRVTGMKLHPDDKLELRILAMAIALVVILPLPVIWTFSYFEAKAFNRVSGSDVSAWEAMFLDLKILERAN